MLYALENLLASSLTESLSGSVKVVPGPGTGVPAEGEQRVEVTASKLAVSPPGEDPRAAREPAFLASLQRWDADGATRDFTLPESVQGDIVEVESPAGHPISLGQDYQVEGTTVRLYLPPARGEGAVVATVSTGPAEGFRERRPCQFQLTVAAWGPTLEGTDALLEMALAVVLTRCPGLGVLEAAHLGNSGVRMRLRQPTVLLEGLERTRVQEGARWVPRAAVQLRVHAELELSVAVGTPRPGRLIDRLHYHGVVMPPK